MRLRGALRKFFKGKEEKKKEIRFKIRRPRRLVVFPKLKDTSKVNITYPLIQPFASAHIRWDKSDDMLVYRLREPKLSKREHEFYKDIVDGLAQIIEVELSAIKKPGKAIKYLIEKTKEVVKELDLELEPKEFNKIMYYIYRNFAGLDKIEPFFHDPYIEDIGCDGVGIPIYLVHKKFGSIRTNITYEKDEELRNFIVKLAERTGRFISYAEPLVDGTLPDGSRVQATLAKDVTTEGPTFSIRKFTKEPYSPTEMIDLGTASAQMLAYLWFCIENGASILICGGVSSGKTTFLNTISLFIPYRLKIVSIEDTREINLPHENWIPSNVRAGFGMPLRSGEKYGEVTMFDLLKASFRQNPDYVIVGEVRGKEAYVMFQGMASGNPAMSTMHASGVDTVVKRLQSPPIELSPALIESLDLVLTMVKAREISESARRIKMIEEVAGVEEDKARAGTVFTWLPTEDRFDQRDAEGTLRKISGATGMPIRDIKKEITRRRAIIKWAHKQEIKNWRDFSKIIEKYRQRGQNFLKEKGISLKE